MGQTEIRSRNNDVAIGIHWVRAELEQNLDLAGRLIEQHAESRKKDSEPIYKALAYVQEVRGVAILIRAYGVALLSEEIRQTLDAMTAGKVKDAEAAYSALIGACVQAGDYLDLLGQERDDSALILQPAVNELRLSRGASLLTEDDLFVAQFRALDLHLPRDSDSPPAGDLQAQAAKLLPAFSASLLAWFKENEPKKAVARLGRISELLAAASADTDMHQLWRTSAACVEALLSDKLEASLELKRQFGRAGQLIKIIAQHGEALAVTKMSDVSLRLLFCVGRSQGKGPRVRALRSELELDHWVPSVEDIDAARSRLRSGNTNLLAKVAEELRSDLSEVRVSIDLALRSGASAEEYEGAQKRLKSVSDTLLVLGLSAESQALADSLEALDAGDATDQAVWMECATSLLQVDLSLEGALYHQLNAGPKTGESAAKDEQSPAQAMAAADLRRGRMAVLRESLVNLARLRARVDAFLKIRDESGLPEAARMLYEVAAGMRMLELDRAEQAVGTVCQYLQSERFGSIREDSRAADQFSDAVSAVEYYLEFLRDESPGDELALEKVVATVARLDAGERLGVATPVPVEAEIEFERELELEPVSEAEIEAAFGPDSGDDPEIAGLSLSAMDDSELKPESVDELPVPTEKPEYHPLDLPADTADVSKELEFAPEPSTDTVAAEEVEVSPEETASEIEMPDLEFLGDAPTDSDASADESEPEVSAFDTEELGALLDGAPESPEEVRGEPAPETGGVEDELLAAFEAETRVPPATAPQADDGIDPEIREIFIEEAGEVLAALQESLPGWQKQSDDHAMMTNLRRGFHTLKGSGRMVGANEFGEFAWEIENLLNRCLDNTLSVTPPVMRVVEDAIELVPGMIEAFRDRTAAPAAARLVAERAHRFTTPEEDEDEDDLEAVFRSDALTRLQMVLRWLSDQDPNLGQTSIPEQVPRTFHTLRGAGLAIGANSIGALSDAIEKYLDGLLRENRPLPRAGIEVLDECCTALNQWISHYGQKNAEPENIQPWLDKINALQDASSASIADAAEDQEMADVFAFEALDLVEKFEKELGAWAESDGRASAPRAAKSTIHTLKGAAQIARAQPIVAVTQAIESLIDPLIHRPRPEPGFFEGLNKIAEGLYTLLDEYRGGRLHGDGREWLAQVSALDAFIPDAAEALPGGAADEFSEPLHLFVGEAAPLLETLDERASVVAAKPGNRFVVAEWLGALNALKESADKAGFQEIGTLSLRLADATRAAAASDSGGGAFEKQVLIGVEGLRELVNEVRAEKSGAAAAVLARFDALSDAGPAPEVEAEAEELLLPDLEAPSDFFDAQAVDDMPRFDEAALAGEELLEPDTAAPQESEASEIQDIADVLDIPSVTEVTDEADPDLVEIFAPEAQELLESLDEAMARWRDDPSSAQPVASMQRDLHTFKGGARMTGLNRLGEAAHHLETEIVVLENSAEGVDDAALDRIGRGLDGLHQLYEDSLSVGSGAGVSRADDIWTPPAIETAAPVSEAAPPADEMRLSADRSEPVPPDLGEAAETADEPDPELLEIFALEAQELLESLQNALSEWRDDPSNKAPCIKMQRDLHTFKGGARMTGLKLLGDAAHALETELVALEQSGSAVDAAAVAKIGTALDAVHQLYDNSKAPPASSMPPPLATAQLESKRPDVPVGEAAAVSSLASEANLPATWDEKLFWRPQGSAATTTEARREAVRVPVERLDAMLNQAGEISIFHSRLEENHASFGNSLSEMEQTVTRIREQLRMMEVETEAQIAARGFARAEDAEDRYEAEFDALEMDRYSRMQELSRALAESVSDLSSLHNTLDHLGTEAEGLLQQQGRINNEVQQGLMGTLMVPFSRQVQRLSRVVRQTAEQNGKYARAEFNGADSEMDRNVLERMTAPLEHLLRNCVVHGIEEPEARKAAGKPEAGVVTVSLKREGAQLLVEVRDDGRGLAFKAIRAQAVKRGLMREDAEVSDEDLARFVFAPGFSTAKSLTQDAGRGIGMDVVAAEVKQLGGTVELTSQAGKGACFSIRLPLMLAVSQALVVQVGEEFFAIPIAAVEGIAREPSESLEKMMADGGEPLAYAGNHYQVRRLGELVGLPVQTRTDSRSKPAILLSLHSAVGGAERRVAVVADKLVGNREVVSKAAGPILGSVAGISGATLMADGQVMLILDVPALIQEAVRRRLGDEAASVTPVVEEEVQSMIMVVDDSITIRRVTERLLTRKGYRVITARDGVDAMATLQTESPDAVLLDIEMPRADGFEVAAFIRNTPRLAKLPILMITSRSGDKHREHARQIGVEKYLIKPFQEENLLAELRDVLTSKSESDS